MKDTDFKEKVQDPGKSGDTTTSSKKVDSLEMNLRKNFSSAVAFAHRFLSSSASHMRMLMFCEIASHVERWHAGQSKKLRSTSAALDWTFGQNACGGW